MAAPPVRFCPYCMQADDHPRHDYGVGDPQKQPHLDCCAERGCPDGSCDILTAEKDSTGADFRAQLTSADFVTKTQPLLDERDEATRTYTAEHAAQLLEIDPATIVPVSLQGAEQ